MKRILLIGLTLLIILGMGFVSPSVVLASDQVNDNLSDQVPFSSLGMVVDTSLTGPFDAHVVRFNLPADWKLLPGAQVQLNLTKYFSSLVVGQSSLIPQGLVAGNLNITFNGVPLESTILQDNGDVSVSIPIPDAALLPDPLSGMYELVLQWDASASCDFNLATSVVIHPDSSLTLPHESADLDLDLAWWPGPVYLENSPEPVGVTLVIPDQPNQMDLQAALAVAVGLGRLSQNKLDLALTPVSQLPSGKRDKDNLIMIGKLESFDVFKDISLAEIGAEESDGIIKMMVSPWNKKRVVVAVTGGSDEGVLKAGEGLNAGTIISNFEKNIAVIQDIKSQPGTENYDGDISLGKLATENITFQTVGTSAEILPFTLPANLDIGADAYIDLVFNHSQLIDYLRSGIVIKINDLPVGSVRLSDATSGFNMIRLIIPPTVVHAGLNQLEIQVDLVPRTICTDPRNQSQWVTVLTTSLLHLPVGSQAPAQSPAENLGQYPWPLANDLDDSAIILPSNNPPSWFVAARLAYDLGVRSGGPGYPEILFADALPGSALPEKNLLIIGNPAELPIMAELNKVLPGPFDANFGLAAEVGARINYRINPQQTVGYLELAQSASSGKMIYAVLGSNGEGVQRAGNALLNPAVLKKLTAGNLAIIQGDKLAVENITLSQQASLATPQVQGTPAVTPVPPGEEPLFKHESWVLPAIIVSLGLIVLLIGLEILVALQRKKT